MADGLYDESIEFPSGKKIILRSINGPASTFIQGENNKYTVKVDSSLAGTTIEGFTITHALGSYGGGIYNDVNGKLTINHCNVSGNTAY